MTQPNNTNQKINKKFIRVIIFGSRICLEGTFTPSCIIMSWFWHKMFPCIYSLMTYNFWPNIIVMIYFERGVMSTYKSIWNAWLQFSFWSMPVASKISTKFWLFRDFFFSFVFFFVFFTHVFCKVCQKMVYMF